MRFGYVLFGAGVAVGAVAVYVGHGGGDGPPTGRPELAAGTEPPSPARAEPTASAVELLTLAAGTVSVAERAQLYRLAAAADRATLETLAAQVAALPPIEGRRLALEALLTRYAELDGNAAAAFARTLDVPAAILTPLYATWARRDSRAALEALSELSAADALTLGVALLDVLGNDAVAAARVLGAARHVDADRFRVEAAIAKAAVDPAGALDDALRLPPTTASTALERIAVVWAARDVYGALGAVRSIADESLRAEFESAVVRASVSTDAAALADYVLGLDADARVVALRTGTLQAFALLDPRGALRAAETMPPEAAVLLRRAALRGLARDDPPAAAGEVAALPPGPEREQLLAIVATSYGRTDPDGALAWAQSLRPPAPGVLGNVLGGLARVDPTRAIELALAASALDRPRAVLALVANGDLDAAHTAQLADRLLATPGRQAALPQLTQTWARRQPREALDWLLANDHAAPSAAIAQAGVTLASADPAAAIGYLDRVPPALRSSWLGSVAEGYARNDARAAASWVARHRGEPGYEAAVAAVAAHTAPRDPTAAARLLGSIDLDRAPDAAASARQVAAAWARQEPSAAGAWARALPNPEAASAAVGIVATQWVMRDPVAARHWSLGLAAGAARDAALVQVLGATAGTAPDALQLLDEFSSAAAQERGVSEAVRIIAQRDAATARQLADRFLTDPGLRQAAERFIANRTTIP